MDIKQGTEFEIKMDRSGSMSLTIPSIAMDASDVLRFAEACSYVASVLIAATVASDEENVRMQ